MDSLLEQATSAAASATHDAYDAQAAAARARNAADEAAHYADQAATAAADANAAAARAQDAANRAATSAQQAQASANTAAAAATSATAAADAAGRSAALATQSAAEAAGYARDAATYAHDAYDAAIDANKSASDAAQAAHDAWQGVVTKLDAEKAQFIEQRKQACQPAMRPASLLDGYSTEDCLLLITGTPDQQHKILEHLQTLCRQLNAYGSWKANACLDPLNLFNPNFQARYPDLIPAPGSDPVEDFFIFIGVGLLTAACEGVCDLLTLLGGAGADLGAADALGTSAALADALAEGKSTFDVLGAEINAELGQLQQLSQEASADAARIAEEGRGIADVVACGSNSFVGDTPVLMADGTAKPIENVQPGDRISNAEPDSPVVEKHTVSAVHVTDDDRDFDDIAVATPAGPATVTATAHHLFWNKTTHAWTAAEALQPGDQLDTPGDRSAAVAANRHFVAAQRTYNLTVEDVHTYYVLAGSAPVLVHNTVPCPEGAEETWHVGRNFDTYQQTFEMHWEKHAEGYNISREQYQQDVKAWADGLAQPGGKVGWNQRRVELDTGDIGTKYDSVTGTQGGITAPDGKVVTYWYGPDK
ncbi:Hint domain-containing protein [Amycolatopsis sp. NPDC050768]|uniref:Hint domain-containing protein n=1 Tax=Amycolatopsis sp. NPDC050768 TaxID=3154839 RepID=UPI003409FAEA